MIEIGDIFLVPTDSGETYYLKTYNINDYRPPESKYAMVVYDSNGEPAGDDFMFVGEGFLFACSRVDKIPNHN